VPALLVALGDSPTLAAYVLLLYVGIQSVEGYVLQPMVQRKTVYLPPAVTLFAQVVFGMLFGALGVVLATPLAASLLVVTRKLYVEDTLGESAGR
jgi:predicted PurR-regulated permease PerM